MVICSAYPSEEAMQIAHAPLGAAPKPSGPSQISVPSRSVLFTDESEAGSHVAWPAETIAKTTTASNSPKKTIRFTLQEIDLCVTPSIVCI